MGILEELSEELSKNFAELCRLPGMRPREGNRGSRRRGSLGFFYTGSGENLDRGSRSLARPARGVALAACSAPGSLSRSCPAPGRALEGEARG